MIFKSKTTISFKAAGKGSGRLSSLFGLTKKTQNTDESLIGLLSRIEVNHETSKEIDIEEMKAAYEFYRENMSSIEDDMKKLMVASKICNNELMDMIKDDVSKIHDIEKIETKLHSEKEIEELEILLKLKRAKLENEKAEKALEKEFGIKEENTDEITSKKVVIHSESTKNDVKQKIGFNVD